MTARDSSISIAFKNIEKISTDLSSNDNIQMTLQNFRESSVKLKAIWPISVSWAGTETERQNVKELTNREDQPWRLIWPSTVKHPEDQKPPADTITVKNLQKRSATRPPLRRRAYAALAPRQREAATANHFFIFASFAWMNDITAASSTAGLPNSPTALLQFLLQAFDHVAIKI
jgi:hypothetical protein